MFAFIPGLGGQEILLLGFCCFAPAVVAVVALLVTQIFLFRLSPWDATIGLLVDLVILGVVAAELDVIADDRTTSPVG